jgi:kinesin family protein C1
LTQNLVQRKALADAFTCIQEDINGHLRQKAEEVIALKAAHDKAAEEWAQQKQALEAEYNQKLEVASQIRQELLSAAERREAELMKLVEARHHELAQVNNKYEAAQMELGSVRAQLAAASEALEAKIHECEEKNKENKVLEVEFQSYKEHHGTSNQQQVQAIAELSYKVSHLTDTVDASRREIATKETSVVQHQSNIHALQRQLMEEEQKRRDMHNLMQEMKGNIRVCCRVRPLLSESDMSLTPSSAAHRVSLGYNGENYNFEFDKVFSTDAMQEAVFEEVSQLVQSALDGYKVCIFAYGQTGSGKTYTMQGDKKSWGVIPRSLQQILQSADQMRAKGWTWLFQASFLEVYNEGIRDLLQKGSEPQQVHTVIHDDAWGSAVTNMTVVEVQSLEEIRSLMTTAAKHRSVGSTDMNDQSSRSHAVFALYLQGTNREQDTELRGALHLVDLAGSERLDKSGAEGSRLRETQHINKSLSSLADVFLAKAENRSHVPFRNSKLTHLMEPCLSGNGKTMMVVNVAPEQEFAHETLCSLRFASQVSQCNTGGKPKRNVKTASGNPCSAKQNTTASSSRPQTPSSRPATPTSRSIGRHTSPWA